MKNPERAAYKGEKSREKDAILRSQKHIVHRKSNKQGEQQLKKRP